MSWFDDLKTPRFKGEKSVPARVAKIPEGLWGKCPSCGEIIQTRQLQENLSVCAECDHHLRIPANERVAILSDDGTFEPYGEQFKSNDPLQFDDQKPYKDRLSQAIKSHKINDAFIAGKAKLEGLSFHLGVFEFKFMGGSMGVVVGEKVTMVLEGALTDKVPAVVVSASGGARMQEGILSLMQMAKTSAVIQRLREEGIPYISILTDPTTGGVAASFAMLGDVIFAEPKALIGFAGPRVIEQTIRQKLPEGFQRSEFLLKHGFIDRIVHRKNLKSELHQTFLRLGNRCKF
ncbi:MAG: acetyl-CoA carboxylase carboxyltransferase subunit beta [Bdellovibrionales bacterium]|nr:acetyl-CoA carboxylase carboxyltransferase subunit beta [Bdellovibrionales bacterium]